MELALPHPGPWLTSQLNDRLGSSKAAWRLVEQGVLIRIRRGAYYDAKAWSALPDEDRHVAILTAHHEGAARGQGPGFAYSHTSAARLHGLHLWNADAALHMTLPKCPGRSGRADDVRVPSGMLPASERRILRGLPTTTLERTLVDSARMMRRGQAQILLDHGLRLGADRRAVEALLADADGKRGVRVARSAWALASELSESPGESLLRYLLSLMPFEMPEQQVEVRTRVGRYRLDFAWVRLKVGLEFDGDVKYFA